MSDSTTTANVMAGSTVSIIVPTLRLDDNFRQCLESLERCDPKPDEVFIVVDGDTDAEVQSSASLNFRVLKTAGQRGPAATRNLGGKSATGDILLFLDSDVTAPPYIVDLVRQSYRYNPGIDAIFGSYDDAPPEPDFFSQYKNLFHHFTHQRAKPESSTFWAGCGAVKRQVFSELGGFDEKYRTPSIEDIEFGYRLVDAGYKIKIIKALQVKHLKKWTLKTLLDTDFFKRAIPWTELILRERNMVNDLNTSKINRLKIIVAIIIFFCFMNAFRNSGSLQYALFFSLTLLVLDLPLIRFFNRVRGLKFTMKVIPWQLFYYLYSGLAFIVGSLRYLCNTAVSKH